MEERQHGLARLIRHSLAYFLGSGVPGVFSFAAIVLYTHLLSPQEYGYYTLVVTGTMLVSMAAFSWLCHGMLRFLPHHQDASARFVSTLASALVLLAVGVMGLAAGVVAFAPVDVPKELLLLGVVIVGAQGWYDFNLAMTRAQLVPLRYGIIKGAKSFLALAFGGMLAYRGWGAMGPILGLVLALIIPMVLVYRLHFRDVPLGHIDTAQLKAVARHGLPLTATVALAAVIQSADRFLLAGMVDIEEAGLYAVGYDLAQHSLGLLFMVVSLAAYPLAVRALESEGVEAARAQLHHNGTALLALGLPATVGLAVLTPNIAGVFLDPAFGETAILLMPIIGLCALISGIKFFHFDISFHLGKQTSTQMWISGVAAALNVGLNLLWIPRFGMIGAAYATLVSYLVALALSVWMSEKVFPMPFPWMNALKIGLACGGMALCLLPSLSFSGPGWLAVQVVVGFVVYAALALLLNVWQARSRLRALIVARWG